MRFWASNQYHLAPVLAAFLLISSAYLNAQTGADAPRPATLPAYDLILQGGHLLDDRNHIDGIFDVAIKEGKIAKVAKHIASSDALKTVDVKGLYVTPGLIDIHVHVYSGTGER